MHPFFNAALTALAGGFAVYFVREAPFAAEPFKRWACFLLAAGTAYVALGQLGLWPHLRAAAGG